MADLFQKVLGDKVETPFPRYSFEEVMRRWGIDKPDLRFDMELVDLTEVVRDCSFKVFADNVAAGGAVMGIVLKEGAGYSRKMIDQLTEQAKNFGAGGLAYILRTPDADKSPIAKFLGDEKIAELTKVAGANKGDALFIIADARMKTQEILGQLRLHLGQKHELATTDEWKFLWVTEFPLFEYNKERGALQAMHNIVSHPLEEDMAMIDDGYATDLPLSDEDHPWRRVRAMQYDLVLNGWEIASGGQRINRRDLQEQVLEILGINKERAERMFGFLLRALEYGAPPHAGLAPGLDRLVALMCGTRSIRDVIAFPKTTNAMSLMDGAPSELDPEQLEELGLILKNDDKS